MSGVRIIHIAINPTSGPVHRPMGREMAMMAQADAGPPPTLEGGSGTVSVNVSVEIELLP